MHFVLILLIEVLRSQIHFGLQWKCMECLNSLKQLWLTMPLHICNEAEPQSRHLEHELFHYLGLVGRGHVDCMEIKEILINRLIDDVHIIS